MSALDLYNVHLPLRAILYHSKGLSAFRQFAGQEHSEECILFWEAVEQFRARCVPAAIDEITSRGMTDEEKELSEDAQTICKLAGDIYVTFSGFSFLTGTLLMRAPQELTCV